MKRMKLSLLNIVNIACKNAKELIVIIIMICI